MHINQFEQIKKFLSCIIVVYFMFAAWHETKWIICLEEENEENKSCKKCAQRMRLQNYNIWLR